MKPIIFALLLLAPSAFAAFPTAGPNPTTSDAFQESRSIAAQIDSRAGDLRAQMGVGSFSLWRILQSAEWMSKLNARLNTLKAVPGILQFARDQLDDQTLNIAAEFTTMQAAVEAYIDAVRTSSPVSGGYAEVVTIGGTAGAITLTEREMTPTQTATLRSLLQTIENSIE